jgi:hypothetical protein
MSPDPTSPTPTQMSLWGASHVSPTHTQDFREHNQTPDISGQKCLGLSKNVGPLGLLEKTLLESPNWAWTKYSLTWRTKATPQGRLIFQLVRLAPRTSGSASGLLHTPTAKANQMAPSMVDRDEGSWGRIWPTPRVSSAKGVAQSEVDKGDPKRRLEVTVQVEQPQTTGKLNPKWVAWLMGYPTEYLNSVPWGTRSSRKSQRK